VREGAPSWRQGVRSRIGVSRGETRKGKNGKKKQNKINPFIPVYFTRWFSI